MSINVCSIAKKTFRIKQKLFLFGPRGTGKTTWIKNSFPNAIYFDLLKAETRLQFLANPSLIEKLIPNNFSNWVVIDEIQQVPELLNEVHRLIEEKQIQFVLTGTSARKLRKKGVNLLAGRALIYHMHPLPCRNWKIASA